MAQLKFQTQRNLVIDMTDPSKYWSLKELSRRSRLESYPLNPLNCPVQLPKRWTGAIRMKRCNKTRSDFFRVFFRCFRFALPALLARIICFDFRQVALLRMVFLPFVLYICRLLSIRLFGAQKELSIAPWFTILQVS